MIYFLFQILVNALAVALTIWLLPGIGVSTNNPLGYLTLGLIFGLLNAVVKPMVVFFSGLVAKALAVEGKG